MSENIKYTAAEIDAAIKLVLENYIKTLEIGTVSTAEVSSASISSSEEDPTVKLLNLVLPNPETGKSAYDIAVDEGFEGTRAEWLLSLKADTSEFKTDLEAISTDLKSLSALFNAGVFKSTSISSLSSPSQLIAAGIYSVAAITEDFCSEFTDYTVGDFRCLLLSTHTTSTSGCRFGNLLIFSPRISDRFWTIRIWEYTADKAFCTQVAPKGGIIGQSSLANTEKPWYKVASVTLGTDVTPSSNTDSNLVMHVHKTSYDDDCSCSGMLRVRVRTGGDGIITAGIIRWEYKGTGIDVNDFVLAYNSESPAIAEIWCKIDTYYTGMSFDVIAEGTRTSRDISKWKFYNTWSVGSMEEITSGFTQVVSLEP